MKTNYETPQIEVIEIEIEGAILAYSSGGNSINNWIEGDSQDFGGLSPN